METTTTTATRTSKTVTQHGVPATQYTYRVFVDGVQVATRKAFGDYKFVLYTFKAFYSRTNTNQWGYNWTEITEA